ncbi:MAG: putative monovalent cation/H+ antiporter subunit [Pseudonocardiales bacterium]|nr:putative monovalent cation/H+ antiporter subunit [Jatrophihabitantaceae bacterium]MCW2603266.1 putative monovalent cation/H+ antiporter subunit [Pseudonocardiales bacterium]
MTKPARTPARALTEAAWQLPLLLWLVAVWMLLWGTFSIANAVNGLILAILVTRLFPLPPVPHVGRLHPWGATVLMGRFLWDLIPATLQVAAHALRPGPPVRSAVIAVQMRSPDDLPLTLTAEMVSLTPGSAIVEMDREARVLYVHVLGLSDRADADAVRDDIRALEDRVLRAVARNPPPRPARAGHPPLAAEEI